MPRALLLEPAGFRRCVGRFLREERGAAAVEYVIVGSLVALLALSGVALMAGETGGLLARTIELFSQATAPLNR